MRRTPGLTVGILALALLVAAVGGVASWWPSLPRPDARAAALLREVDATFTAGGRPVHPKLVGEFLGWVGDGGAVTLAIDLSASLGTDEYFDGHAERRGREFIHREPGVPGSIGYRHLGRLADGTHVVRTLQNGGGTLTLRHLLFLGSAAEPVGRTGRWRVVLRVAGDHHLTGRVADLRVVADGVQIHRPGGGVEVVRPW